MQELEDFGMVKVGFGWNQGVVGYILEQELVEHNDWVRI